MEITKESLVENYMSMDEDVLIERSLGELTDIAREAIEEVIEERGIKQEYIEAKSKARGVSLKAQHELESNLASPSVRLFAQVVDTFIALLFFSISIFGDIGIIIGTILALAYIWFADGLLFGRSVGKLITNTKVVIEKTKAPCSYLRSFARNFPLTVLGLFDWVFIFGEKRQRLGDLIAGTVVVNTKPSKQKPF